MIYTLLVATPTLLVGVGVAARTVYVRREGHREPEPTKPDYGLIANLEKELGLWTKPLLPPSSHYRGMDSKQLHLELDLLWRKLRTDDSPEVRQRIDELVVEYQQAQLDEQGREEAR